MIKKILNIFSRDVKTNARDSMSLLLILFPVVFAIGINLIVPSINNTTINVAMISGADSSREDFFGQFANVTLVKDRQALDNRVADRDDVFGLYETAGVYSILAEGNEPESLVDYAKLINVLYETDGQLTDARSEIVEFGRTSPPLKVIMVNALLLFISVFSGMLIALNILEEKADHTVSAVNVSPISRSAFILGKSLTGMVFSLVLSVVCLVITGYYTVNLLQALLVLLAMTVLSMIIGFVQGIGSSDAMEAAGSVKLMFLPMFGSVIGYELLSDRWQMLLYWSPFYWAYRANALILSKSGTWPQLLLYTGFILAICLGVYLLLAPRIRKGLQ